MRMQRRDRPAGLPTFGFNATIIGMGRDWDTLETELAGLPEALKLMVQGWTTRHVEISLEHAVLETSTRARLLRSYERAEFRALLREHPEVRRWWRGPGVAWVAGRQPGPWPKRRVKISA